MYILGIKEVYIFLALLIIGRVEQILGRQTS